MNKKLLYAFGVVILAVLGYFAMQDNSPQISTSQPHDHDMESSGMMNQMNNGNLEIVQESAAVQFKTSYSIDDEWSLNINQFEPNAKIMDPGTIGSDSNEELNPAIKVNFYENGEFVHYQIVFKEMPGFHSVKPGQKYLLDFNDYNGFQIMGENSYSIESANLKISRIK